jgi:hypothetical protein
MFSAIDRGDGESIAMRAFFAGRPTLQIDYRVQWNSDSLVICWPYVNKHTHDAQIQFGGPAAFWFRFG